MESNDSPEIPGRGETSDIPGLHWCDHSVTVLARKTQLKDTLLHFLFCSPFIKQLPLCPLISLNDSIKCVQLYVIFYTVWFFLA